ncbi:hypothetical protein BJV78DRAFT_40307 [Lactifluus subvellereus]|nr:hypothetical protein BJV78DRAFT_40307 [Lactifluus subvellereus]
MSAPLPPTTNDLHDRDKQRLLRQARKLSQIFGELPQETTALPHLARSITPAGEVPSTDPPHLHIPFSRRSSIDQFTHSFRLPASPRSVPSRTMSPQPLPSAPDALGPDGPPGRLPALPLHISQLDVPRFGLSRLRKAASSISIRPDEQVPHGNYLPIAAEMPSRSSSVHLFNRVHLARSRDSSRRRSVNNPVLPASHAHSRKSDDISTPVHSQRRSMSLWPRRRNAKDDAVHQWHLTADQGREDAASSEAYQPLTGAQRTQSLRRGRKLAQVFGTVPPAALYRMPSHLEDIPATPTSVQSVQSERMKAYLTLSSSDLVSVYSGRSSRRRSRSSTSSISICFPPSDATTNEIDSSYESRGDPTPAPIFPDSDDDSNPIAHISTKGPDASATFRLRRWRAAKLSRFFGVDYNDLSSSIAMTVPRCRTASEESVPPAEVGVKIQDRGRFWNRPYSGSHYKMPRA